MGWEKCRYEWRLKHLIVHGSVTAGGDLSNLSVAGSIVGFTSREVVGHLGIQLFNSLLLGTWVAATALSASTGLSLSTSSTGGSLFCGSGLGLVLLGLAACTC